MSNEISPHAVLCEITKLKALRVEMAQWSGTNSDFAFKWAARNGGVPKTKVATQKLLADYRARFPQQPAVSDQHAMELIEERYHAWAKERGIATITHDTLERFDDETGLMTAQLDEISGFTRPKKLAHQIGHYCEGLSRAAVALGCNDSTAAALKAMAALLPDIVEGRAVLDDPATWTEARLQANELLQSESIAGIPLKQAWEVALERLEHAAKTILLSEIRGMQARDAIELLQSLGESIDLVRGAEAEFAHKWVGRRFADLSPEQREELTSDSEDLFARRLENGIALMRRMAVMERLCEIVERYKLPAAPLKRWMQFMQSVQEIPDQPDTMTDEQFKERIKECERTSQLDMNAVNGVLADLQSKLETLNATPELDGQANKAGGKGAKVLDIPDGNAEPALHPDDVKILRALALAGTTLTQEALSHPGRTGLDVKTVNTRLRRLRNMKLTNRPFGPKGGEAITPKGRAALAKLSEGI